MISGEETVTCVWRCPDCSAVYEGEGLLFLYTSGIACAEGCWSRSGASDGAALPVGDPGAVARDTVAPAAGGMTRGG
jgi:hypothetical protein